MAKPSQYGHGWQVYEAKGKIAGHDYCKLTQTSTTDVYTYRDGSASGTLLATLTITFTDSTKATMDFYLWTYP